MNVGDQFGRLTLLEPVRISRRGYWKCRCCCGTVKVIGRQAIRTGATRSCGCLLSEIARRPRKHGECRGSGKSTRRSPEYISWLSMRKRCEKPNTPDYKNYGARGIRVCNRWKTFANFLKDMGRKPQPGYTLERINNDGNYEPGNVRWASSYDQSRNNRRNRYLTIGGKKQVIADWSKQTGVHYETIRARLRRGWDARSAVFGRRGVVPRGR